MPKIRISVNAAVSVGDTDPVYEASAMQSLDDGNTWTEVVGDDSKTPIETAAGSKDTARARMVTALNRKFGEDGWELDEPDDGALVTDDGALLVTDDGADDTA